MRQVVLILWLIGVESPLTLLILSAYVNLIQSNNNVVAKCTNQTTEMATSPLTKILHTFLVCIIEEEVTLFDCPVHLKAQPQTGILHQV